MEDLANLIQKTNELLIHCQHSGIISPWSFITDVDGVTTVRNVNTGETRDPTSEELEWLHDTDRFED